MGNTEKSDVSKTLLQAKWLLGCGIVLIIILPLILTGKNFWQRLDFSNTGDIGDTIGGITAPIVGLVGAALVYLALTAQVEANRLVQGQIHNQSLKDKIRDEVNDVNQLYFKLKDSIDNFTFVSLDTEKFGTGKYLTGSEAIYKLFNDFYCDCHISDDELKSNPKITELVSILEICDAALVNLEASSIPNKKVTRTLIKHQFRYRVFPRISMQVDDLAKHKCNVCNKDHGLPEHFVTLIKKLEQATAL